MLIVDLVIKSILLCLLGLAAAYLMRRCSSSARHMALLITLGGLCLLPFASIFLPSWNMPFLRLDAGVQLDTAPVAQSAKAAFDPALLILIGYTGITLTLLARLVVKVIRLKGVEKRLKLNTDPYLTDLVESTCLKPRAKETKVLRDPQNTPPMTWGHLRPKLCLPVAALEWTAERLKAVVTHEVAHIERGDWVVSLASEAICAVFWFNPFAWIIKSKLDWESEAAADDRVLANGLTGAQYAGHLVDLVRELQAYPRAAKASMAISRPETLERRIKNILEESNSRRTVGKFATLGLSAAASGLVLLVATAAPTLVRTKAFQTRPMVAELTAKPPVPNVDASVETLASDEAPVPTQGATPKAHNYEVRADSNGVITVSNGPQSVTLEAPIDDEPSVQPEAQPAPTPSPQPQVSGHQVATKSDDDEIPGLDLSSVQNEMDKAIADATKDIANSSKIRAAAMDEARKSMDVAQAALSSTKIEQLIHDKARQAIEEANKGLEKEARVTKPTSVTKTDPPDQDDQD